MKRLLLACCTLALLLTVSACAVNGGEDAGITPPADIVSFSDEAVSKTDTDITSPDADTIPSDTDAEDSDATHMHTEPVMHTMMASEGWESGFSQIYRYGNDGYEINVLWCDCDIRDFKLLPIDMNLESARICGVGEPVFELSELKAGEAIELDIYVPEIIPTHAISYTAGDTEYFFMICYNGRDGGISLVEEQ